MVSASPAASRTKKGGEPPGVARHRHCGRRCRFAAGRDRAERALEGVGQIKRGVGDRERRGDGIGGTGQPDGARRRGHALVGELERHRALARQQHIAARKFGERLVARAFDREQVERAVGARDAERPAAPQRVDRARRVPGACVAQKSNSVMSGIWSDGRSQLRVG
jgi:hypothetical protein